LFHFIYVYAVKFLTIKQRRDIRPEADLFSTVITCHNHEAFRRKISMNASIHAGFGKIPATSAASAVI
jgi:hypothetical protein